MIDFLLVLMYIAVIATLVVTGWSAARSLSLRDHSQRVVNNIPVRRIAWATAALFFLLLIVGFLVGSSAPMTVNGEDYSRWFWLKVSDMFIFTSALLIIIAAVLVVASKRHF